MDVVENNRKVTHGCIIATIKLYLPDGKEAKASPSITDSDRHGKKIIVQFFFIQNSFSKLLTYIQGVTILNVLTLTVNRGFNFEQKSSRGHRS